MADQRELQFDGEQAVDYTSKVFMLVNAGDYTEARKVLYSLPVTKIIDVRRTIAARTNVYL